MRRFTGAPVLRRREHLMDAHLRHTLEEMHRELQREVESAKFVNERDEALLHELLDDISRLLESAERGEHEPVSERLANAIEQFEESHPTLTGIMTRLSQALGRLAV
jgi:hypothetical protein